MFSFFFRLSGFMLPSPIVSTGSILALWFTTDFAVSAQGFKAIYEGKTEGFFLLYIGVLNTVTLLRMCVFFFFFPFSEWGQYMCRRKCRAIMQCSCKQNCSRNKNSLGTLPIRQSLWSIVLYEHIFLLLRNIPVRQGDVKRKIIAQFLYQAIYHLDLVSQTDTKIQTRRGSRFSRKCMDCIRLEVNRKIF